LAAPYARAVIDLADQYDSNPQHWVSRLPKPLSYGSRLEGNFLPMSSFLACHDYGQGGVWFYVEGDSVDQVSREFPALMFFPSDPPWWNEEFEQIARQNDPAKPPFSDILEKARAP
jgi:hypothetical protein